MALDGIVRGAVKTIDKISKPLQCTVVHKQWISGSGFGVRTFDSVQHKCILEIDVERFANADGKIANAHARLTFLETVLPNGATGRQEPIDDRDEFVLPDGSSQSVVEYVSGVVDPVTKAGFNLIVYVGKNKVATS